MDKLTTNGIIDAGIDWLTLTASPEKTGFDDCISIWQFLLNSAENEGHSRNVSNFNGYLGEHCGQYFYGGRETDMMFMASGAAGMTAFELVKEVEFHGNVSQLHVQTTIDRAAANAATYAQLAEIERKLWRAGKTHKCRKMVCHESPEGSDSVQFGSNRSSSRLLVYNAAAKHPERYSGEAQRYEARFDGRTSPQPFASLRSAKSATSCCKQIVVGKCERVGLKQRWHKDIPPIEPMSGTVKTDDDSKMAWLLEQVRATAVRLTLLGRGDEVAFALGCEEFIVREEVKRELGGKGKLRKLYPNGIR